MMNIIKDDMTERKFGKLGQLTCLGNNGMTGNKKFQVLSCSICGADEELFPENIFLMTKNNLERGCVPCGCGRGRTWTKEQKTVLAQRAAKENGYTFIDYAGDYEGARTKCILKCEDHGFWETTQLNNLLSKGTGCPSCKSEASIRRRTKDDDTHIADFFKSGQFHPDTKFKRSLRKNAEGRKVYWDYYCPVCQEVGCSPTGDLKAGRKSCGCSLSNQDEAYISFVMDGGQCKAIKYGISKNSLLRNETHNKKNLYDIVLFGVWRFPNKEKCRRAENACKRMLDSGILLREEMVDGWSETTYPRHIDTIIYLYKKFGGVRIK